MKVVMDRYELEIQDNSTVQLVENRNRGEWCLFEDVEGEIEGLEDEIEVLKDAIGNLETDVERLEGDQP